MTREGGYVDGASIGALRDRSHLVIKEELRTSSFIGGECVTNPRELQWQVGCIFSLIFSTGRDFYKEDERSMLAPIGAITPEMIVSLIQAHVPDIGAEQPLSGDTDLWRAGMDSLSSVSVIVAVEEEYDVEFPDELLTREVFSTAAAIAAAVRTLR
ncbi:phosphopantetheine-binding protein [Streptomyces sp. VB1]|uniref:phosphopantetheine-binding protein n=1 Tax=Streptomyces sp. VB1 TaxID=2986803 RepID=UPI002242B8D5|nr:phosphopantetheine-binding protein [Streptomyces sp. VB1]UZI32370.1 phosphopantetheine-binding protein [Streptomyces sp. VB1]